MKKYQEVKEQNVFKMLKSLIITYQYPKFDLAIFKKISSFLSET